MVKANEFAKSGCKYLGEPYSEMDCQKFYEKALKDAGKTLDLPGSNAWYRKMTWTGSPEDCKKRFGSIPAGATLFIWAKDGGEPEKYKPDGKGNASHIGIYTAMTGNEMVDIALAAGDKKAVNYNYGDGAIHSSSSRGHVCTSKFSGKSISGGWNRVGLWSEMDYGSKINSLLSGKEEPDIPDPGGDVPVTEATVFADSGTTVKLRLKPSTNCPMYWDVPIGSTVDVLEDGDQWSKVSWDGKTGYMMSQFLKPGTVIPGEDDPPVPDDKILVSRADLKALYDMIGNLLGIRG